MTAQEALEEIKNGNFVIHGCWSFHPIGEGVWQTCGEVNCCDMDMTYEEFLKWHEKDDFRLG